MTVVDVSGMLYTYTSISKNSKSVNSVTVKGVNIAGVKAVLELCAKNLKANRRTVLCLDSFTEKKEKAIGGYKANRTFNPDIAVQNMIIEQYFPYFGVDVLKCNGREADDLIYSVVHSNVEEYLEIEVMTGDKDVYGCLISDKVYITGINSNTPSVDVLNYPKVVCNYDDLVPYNCILPHLTLFGKRSNNLGVLKIDKMNRQYFNDYLFFIESRGDWENASSIENLIDFLDSGKVREEHIETICERALLTYPKIEQYKIDPIAPKIDSEKLIQFLSYMRLNVAANIYGATKYLNTVPVDRNLETLMKNLYLSVKNGTMCSDLGIDPSLNSVQPATTSEFLEVDEW